MDNPFASTTGLTSTTSQEISPFAHLRCPFQARFQNESQEHVRPNNPLKFEINEMKIHQDILRYWQQQKQNTTIPQQHMTTNGNRSSGYQPPQHMSMASSQSMAAEKTSGSW